jgi:hypothetical protein
VKIERFTFHPKIREATYPLIPDNTGGRKHQCRATQFPEHFQTQDGFTGTRGSNNMQSFVIRMIINCLQHTLLIRTPGKSELHRIENHHNSFLVNHSSREL